LLSLVSSDGATAPAEVESMSDQFRAQLRRLVEDHGDERNDERERDLRAFYALQRGRTVPEIQAAYRLHYPGYEISDERARAASEGAPVTVVKAIKAH
jgi:hypothetical protein